jgi:hypothetical protein
MSSANLTCVLLFPLAENARTTLPDWYNDVCSQARNLCAQHEPTGALTQVATDKTWNDCPGHITNLVAVLSWHITQRGLSLRHTQQMRQRQWSPYREELARNHAFAAATSAMAQALLTSIGPDNKTFLEAHFNVTAVLASTRHKARKTRKDTKKCLRLKASRAGTELLLYMVLV